ncbi:PAN2-PAN3 deadenylation complex subunit [Lachnellula suecica]|uniref:PAN2-PAN3 deadenylation complex subunit n=1 Tax=Lachnellula suecica TaxID=602035 RepID=A0A8T9BVW8_9HELO|nr:PAN2-PAN3 deadenylation complex subunit [Lachnellula suecica]
MAATRFNSPELRKPASSPRPKGRDNAKDTLCRNVLIYGHCRYEDQGCAFNHDPNKTLSGPADSARLRDKAGPDWTGAARRDFSLDHNGHDTLPPHLLTTGEKKEGSPDRSTNAATYTRITNSEPTRRGAISYPSGMNSATYNPNTNQGDHNPRTPPQSPPTNQAGPLGGRAPTLPRRSSQRSNQNHAGERGRFSRPTQLSELRQLEGYSNFGGPATSDQLQHYNDVELEIARFHSDQMRQRGPEPPSSFQTTISQNPRVATASATSNGARSREPTSFYDPVRQSFGTSQATSHFQGGESYGQADSHQSYPSQTFGSNSGHSRASVPHYKGGASFGQRYFGTPGVNITATGGGAASFGESASFQHPANKPFGARGGATSNHEFPSKRFGKESQPPPNHSYKTYRREEEKKAARGKSQEEFGGGAQEPGSSRERIPGSSGTLRDGLGSQEASFLARANGSFRGYQGPASLFDRFHRTRTLHSSGRSQRNPLVVEDIPEASSTNSLAITSSQAGAPQFSGATSTAQFRLSAPQQSPFTQVANEVPLSQPQTQQPYLAGALRRSLENQTPDSAGARPARVTAHQHFSAVATAQGPSFENGFSQARSSYPTPNNPSSTSSSQPGNGGDRGVVFTRKSASQLTSQNGQPEGHRHSDNTQGTPSHNPGNPSLENPTK